jgi:hypothetical protein
LPARAGPPGTLARQPPNRYLRKASENELADFYVKHADSETPEAIRGREHVFAEP